MKTYTIKIKSKEALRFLFKSRYDNPAAVVMDVIQLNNIDVIQEIEKNADKVFTNVRKTTRKSFGSFPGCYIYGGTIFTPEEIEWVKEENI